MTSKAGWMYNDQGTTLSIIDEVGLIVPIMKTWFFQKTSDFNVFQGIWSRVNKKVIYHLPASGLNKTAVYWSFTPLWFLPSNIGAAKKCQKWFIFQQTNNKISIDIRLRADWDTPRVIPNIFLLFIKNAMVHHKRMFLCYIFFSYKPRFYVQYQGDGLILNIQGPVSQKS